MIRVAFLIVISLKSSEIASRELSLVDEEESGDEDDGEDEVEDDEDGKDGDVNPSLGSRSESTALI